MPVDQDAVPGVVLVIRFDDHDPNFFELIGPGIQLPASTRRWIVVAGSRSARRTIQGADPCDNYLPLSVAWLKCADANAGSRKMLLPQIAERLR